MTYPFSLTITCSFSLTFSSSFRFREISIVIVAVVDIAKIAQNIIAVIFHDIRCGFRLQVQQLLRVSNLEFQFRIDFSIFEMSNNGFHFTDLGLVCSVDMKNGAVSGQ